MKPHAQAARRPAGAIAVLAAAAGLVLTGCGPSAGSGASSAATQSTGTAQSTGGASSGSGASSGGSSSTTVTSASLPFPTTAGDTWFYQNSNGSTSENKIASSKQTAAGQAVLMDTTFTANGTTTRAHYSYVVQPNGQISLPFSQFGGGGTPGFSVKVVSGGMYWPSAAELASGQPHHSTLTLEYTIAGKKSKATTHITATGEGTQSVTVPAGTYNATVVSEVEKESFEGTTIDIDVKTWLATGIGPVQSELVDIDGNTKTISNKEELTSFVKG